MIQCKECQWWAPGSVTDTPGLHRCGHPKGDAGWDMWVGGKPMPADAFGVVNGEPYNEGVFATGPEFGCIHGERAESGRGCAGLCACGHPPSDHKTVFTGVDEWDDACCKCDCRLFTAP